MKIERTKNASRNIFYGIMLKMYQILIPFLMRTAIIYFMGVQYLGLNSLFASILQVLNLAELGVGSAMVYGMYKPIVEDDEKTICALMRLYKRYYRAIGWVIAVVGVILTPFIPRLINGNVPHGISVYALYLINLTATVLSYWIFAYKNSILQAHQRSDVVSKVSLVVNTIQYGGQLLAIAFLKNYYIYALIVLAVQIVNNITTAVVATKMYPRYKAEGSLTKAEIVEINQRICDLFTSKIGYVVVNSADTIVISAFLGLTALAVYQNYYFIITSVIGIVGIVFGACTAGIGNSIIVESKDKNFRDLNKFTFIIAWIGGFCVCCLMCLYQPFMEIWVGKKFMLQFSVVVCFCVYYFIYEINQLLNTYKDASGMWHEDRFRPLVTAIANLVMNLLMVHLWGIYGVILSTVLSMIFIGMPWLLYNLFTIIFEKDQLVPYVKHLFKYIVVTVVACTVTYLITIQIHIEGLMILFIRGILCCVISNVIFFVAYRRSIEFSESIQIFDKITGGKIRVLRKLM